MVRRPVDSSILSKHTGHVGSSIRAGVGGAFGLLLRLDDGLETCWDLAAEPSDLLFEGVKGSLDMSGNDPSPSLDSRERNLTDFTKTT